jgi:hypothetical protein
MKFWTLILGLISAIAAKKGFSMDPEIYWTIVGAFGVLIGAQGAADWGKNAAIAAAPKTVEQNVSQPIGKAA